VTDPRNPDQFGLSEHEQAEIHGNALGAHLWEGMEGILGNMRVHAQGQAYDELSKRFGSHNVQIDQENDPHYEVTEGPYALRYHGGPTLNYYKHGENVSASTDYEHEGMLSHHLRNRLHRWIEEEGKDI
jgi:hypothetical protein